MALQAGAALTVLLESANNLLIGASKRPAVDTSVFREFRRQLVSGVPLADCDTPICTVPELVGTYDHYPTADWNYDKWIEPGSCLTVIQRNLLEDDVILKQPLRMLGAAGSGKTLIMQLLGIRRLRLAQETSDQIRILYVVHNGEMANTVRNRFMTLGASEFLNPGSSQYREISTLFEYCRSNLDLPFTSIIDKDAHQTKAYQREMVLDCTNRVFKNNIDEVSKSPLFSQLLEKDYLVAFVDLISSEIAVTIKGRDLTNSRNRYVESEKPLSRLHHLLSQSERRILFDIYVAYHHLVFEQHEVLDSDDVALTLLGRLRTPLWEMKRRKHGFDFVFVDETQLFNENERLLFSFLTKGDRDYIPIVLALDEAQELRGAVSSGFGILGIENLSNQMLYSVHRSTRGILALAFFIIQRTTDLFSTEFPDFTSDTVTLVPDDHPLAKDPKLVVRGESPNISKSVLKEVRALRKEKIKQIGIVVHSEKYWAEIQDLLMGDRKQLNLIVHTTRGEAFDPKQSVIVLTRPESVGGQEFDAVISVGLEKGMVPRNVSNHGGLSAALEQQALREMYLAFTRARYRLIIVNSKESTPNSVIQAAINAGLIVA